MKHFEVTIIHNSERTVRNVIALSTVRATQIALACLPDIPGQFALICKPAQVSVQPGQAIPCLS